MKQTFEFSSHPSNLASVRAFVRQFLKCTSVPESQTELLVLGIDEACSNIIRHAYRQLASQPITLSCEQLERALRFTLRDFGEHADPAQFNGRPLDDLAPGGLGLHLIRKAFDQVDYNLKTLGTELILVKAIDSSAA